MNEDKKEKIQYMSALSLLASGVILSFLSFFLNHYRIDDSVLWYVAQTLVYAGSTFGFSIYIKSKMGEIENRMHDEK